VTASVCGCGSRGTGMCSRRPPPPRPAVTGRLLPPTGRLEPVDSPNQRQRTNHGFAQPGDSSQPAMLTETAPASAPAGLSQIVGHPAAIGNGTHSCSTSSVTLNAQLKTAGKATDRLAGREGGSNELIGGPRRDKVSTPSIRRTLQRLHQSFARIMSPMWASWQRQRSGRRENAHRAAPSAEHQVRPTARAHLFVANGGADTLKGAGSRPPRTSHRRGRRRRQTHGEGWRKDIGHRRPVELRRHTRIAADLSRGGRGPDTTRRATAGARVIRIIQRRPPGVGINTPQSVRRDTGRDRPFAGGKRTRLVAVQKPLEHAGGMGQGRFEDG